MAKKAKLKYNGQYISPATEGRCVTMEDGSTAENAIKDLKNSSLKDGAVTYAKLNSQVAYLESILNPDAAAPTSLGVIDQPSSGELEFEQAGVSALRYYKIKAKNTNGGSSFYSAVAAGGYALNGQIVQQKQSAMMDLTDFQIVFTNENDQEPEYVFQTRNGVDNLVITFNGTDEPDFDLEVFEYAENAEKQVAKYPILYLLEENIPDGIIVKKMISSELLAELAGGGEADKLRTPRAIGGVSFDGTADIKHYASCGTAGGTAAKTVAITGFQLVSGAKIAVKFTYGLAAGSNTLNVSGTGAKQIRYKGGNLKKPVKNNTVLILTYNGSSWDIAGDLVAEERTDAVLFEGELVSGSQSVDSFLNYDAVEFFCLTTAGEATPCPFTVKFSVQEMYENEFVVSHVNGDGYLCSAKLLYTGSASSLSVSDNKTIDLSSGSTLPVNGIKIYKIVGYKA